MIQPSHLCDKELGLWTSGQCSLRPKWGCSRSPAPSDSPPRRQALARFGVCLRIRPRYCLYITPRTSALDCCEVVADRLVFRLMQAAKDSFKSVSIDVNVVRGISLEQLAVKVLVVSMEEFAEALSQVCLDPLDRRLSCRSSSPRSLQQLE